MKKLITLILLLTLNNVFAQAPTIGLVAYWPLDGNFNEASGNIAAGTNTLATSTADKNGNANKAMAFSNPSTSAQVVPQWGSHPVTFSLNFGATQNYTLSFWVYFNSPFNHTCGIYDNNLNSGGYGVYFTNSPYLQIVFSCRQAQTITTSGAIPLATWKHISCVKNGTATSIYVDGVLNVTGTQGAATPSYTLAGRFGTLSFSGYPSPNNYLGMEGKLDDVRMYNRALTVAEISSIILPIKLTNFSGSINKKNTTFLNWQTDYEQNSKDFIVERSFDNIKFDSVGKVLAAGNSSTLKVYNFEDDLNNINCSKVYYRIQQNDIDGKQTFSEIISLKKVNSKAEISFYPNPAKDKIQVQAYFNKNEEATIMVMDQVGKIHIQKTLKIQTGNNSFPLDISSLQTGSYFLKIKTLDEDYVKEILKL